jgi:hypothetical protein
MNTRRCSRRANAQVALGALRQVRNEKQWARRPTALQEAALRFCVRQPLVHHRHDGMETQQTRTDGLFESTSCLRKVSAFRTLHASATAPLLVTDRETAKSRIGIVKGRPRRRSLGCPEDVDILTNIIARAV